MQIDASEGIARVIFDQWLYPDQKFLGNIGVLQNGYQYGSLLNLPEGNLYNVTVYSGDKKKEI